MELALSLGSVLGIGGSTATAAAGGAAAAGGSSLFTSILQGTLTAFSAAASIGQGIAARDEAKIEELNVATQANRDKIAAEDEAIRLNRAIAEVVGEQSAAYAAAGISLGSGTPVDARREAQRRANEDLNINRSNRNARAAAWNQRALAARRRGQNAFSAGILNAVGDIGGFALDVANRGGPFAPAQPNDRWRGARRVTA